MREARLIMADLGASGLSAEQAALVMELSAALSVEARPVEDKAANRRRARDRAYQAERRQNRPKSADAPPYEDTSTPPGSEANASGSEAADPIKQVFDLGVHLLTETGMDEKQARSLIGKWRKAKNDDGAVLTALLDCRGKSISNPVEWLEKRLQSAKHVSASGYEYRGSAHDVMREAERRADWDTYYAAKAEMDAPAQPRPPPRRRGSIRSIGDLARAVQA